MKITIVETGLPPEELRNDWPRYPEMFRALMSPADPGIQFETVSVALGEQLPEPSSLEGVLITGSASGVYDPEPWMESLFRFIRATAGARTPQFGICFGHQAMAEALGGKAEKSTKGWAIGRNTYDVCYQPEWMAGATASFSIAASHQDQVVTAPPATQVTAQSDFCSIAGLHYQTFPAASFQGHPEFSAGFSSALHQSRRERIGKDQVDRALESFKRPLDGALVGQWMVRFFQENRSA
ncbi:MAG: glutamine amidotransferase [Pseudomonadota bacterium]